MTQCFWCLSKTTGDKNQSTEILKFANKEHIFPEAVGGINTLPIGDVCMDCNNRLGGNVDRFLKTGNFAMMSAYQNADGITGKVRGRADKERKTKEKKDISTYHGGTHVKRKDGVVTLTNLPDGSLGDTSYDGKFSRALHKCAANVLCDLKGSEYVSNNHRGLCDFIDKLGEEEDSKWSYAVCYQNMFSTQVRFEPYLIKHAVTVNPPDIVTACILVFPSGLYIVGCLPDILNEELLSRSVHALESDTPDILRWKEEGQDFFEHYSSTFCSDENKDFGDRLRFNWIKV